jgi:spermidine/putrescine transport system substrate-binding protein
MPERPIWERAYDRKGFLAVSAATAFLAACGGDDDGGNGNGEAAGTGADAMKKLGGTLYYYNWADYVNPKTYTAFTKSTGVQVKKDFYVSNEDMLAKLKAGARGYDLIVPTANPFVKIMADDGLLQELDYSKLPNVEKNIDPKFKGLPFDPDNKWSTPKDWGTTGFVYRTDLVKEKPTTWKEFFDLTKGPYSKKVTVLDSVLEVTGSTAMMLGYDYNTDDEGELDEVRDAMLDLKPHILAITSTEYRQMLVSGRAAMALGWNGDGQAVAAEKPAQYVIPEEGAEFWIDAYCVTKDANNPDAAHAWIDFCYQPENNATETEYTYYGSPLKRELLEGGVLDPEVLSNETVFPPPEIVDKLTVADPTPEGERARNRIWTEFKAA